MRFWVDFPLEQWIELKKEQYNLHPWMVLVGGYVRARFTTEEEAKELVKKLYKAFE